MENCTLLLADGTTFRGTSFGAPHAVAGEIVFNTAMVGYVESLTDPSYAGQLMVLTYPLIGNYGVPAVAYDAHSLPVVRESPRIHAAALIVADYAAEYSHWHAGESLGAWLQREQVPGITGIDTRQLTKVLREQGVMTGKLLFDDDTTPLADSNYENINFVAQVSCKEVLTYSPSTDSEHSGRTPRVVLVDCGVKANIIRCLLRRGIEVVRVPWDYDFTAMDFDALFLANGPGNPDQCETTVQHIRSFLAMTPVRSCMGICMGNQLLAKAAGGTIYKMKYGHRSHNQPVRRVGSDTCFITSQNHGYAVDTTTLYDGWQPLFENMNDGTNEGIRHIEQPWFSAQFHPEACAGPVDTMFLFDHFATMIK